MTNEEKQLLLKDICVRLPYGVKIQYTTGDGMHIDCGVDMVAIVSECVGIFELGTSKVVWRRVENIKLYLRPMSSMTEEELDECRATCKYRQVGQSVLDCATPETIDYLIAHHFDYRGLIEKGLAFEAPEGMYKTE